MILHEKQREIVRNDSLFKVIRAGRRFGKTALETETMIFEAMQNNDMPVFYIAPTQKQAREIIWETLKRRLAGIGKPNESMLEMRVPTKNAGLSIMYISGWENRENFRGKKAKHIVFDEVDTMRNFLIGWQEIFRPALMDLRGGADFIGTPKKENPNLRRLEKIAQTDSDYQTFHFTTYDNPFIDKTEIEKAKRELDYDTFKQEILAEYLDNAGALFHYDALVDVFSNIVDDGERYLTVDIADDGSDKTIFSFWRGLCEYRREEFSRLNTEGIISQIREYAKDDRIPYSHILVDAIGVGAGVASSSLLDGIIGYKSSYQAIKTDANIVRLPNVNYTKIAAALVSDYKNLRSQCVFTLSDKINNHLIASMMSGRQKEAIIEELSNYQDTSKGDGKRMATQKEEVKDIIGRSPDASDTWIMRMYFEVMRTISPVQSEEYVRIVANQNNQFAMRKQKFKLNSTR